MTPPRVETEWSSITELHDEAWSGAILKVAALARLHADWDSYGSPPPASTNVVLTVGLLRETWDFHALLSPPEVSPTPGGGIGLAWVGGTKTLEVMVMPDGSAEYLRVSPDGGPEEGPLLTLSELRDHLIWIAST
jgi:hypothetical protein